jgi:hypothetical protein
LSSWKNEKTGTQHLGIDLSIGTTFQAFGVLQEICSCRAFKESGSLWFVDDTAAWENPRSECWLMQLSAATAATITGFINLRLQLDQESLTDQQFLDIMETYPTPAWSGNQYPEFPIARRTLLEHYASFKESLSLEDLPADTPSGRLLQKAQAIDQELPDVDADWIQESLQIGAALDQDDRDFLQSELEQIDSEAADGPSIDYSNSATLPIVPPTAIYQSPLAQAFLGANVYGRTQLNLRMIEFQTRRLTVIITKCLKEKEKLEQQAVELLDRLTEYEKTMEILHKVRSEASQVEKEHGELQARVNKMNNDPDYQAYLREEQNTSTKQGSSTRAGGMSVPSALGPPSHTSAARRLSSMSVPPQSTTFASSTGEGLLNLSNNAINDQHLRFRELFENRIAQEQLTGLPHDHRRYGLGLTHKTRSRTTSRGTTPTPTSPKGPRGTPSSPNQPKASSGNDAISNQQTVAGSGQDSGSKDMSEFLKSPIGESNSMEDIYG